MRLSRGGIVKKLGVESLGEMSMESANEYGVGNREMKVNEMRGSGWKLGSGSQECDFRQEELGEIIRNKGEEEKGSAGRGSRGNQKLDN